MFTLYVLYSESFDRFYVGYTSDLVRRLSEHNRKKGKFRDAGIPWKLVYSETFNTKKQAMDRERFIKAQKSKKFIISLIASYKVEHSASYPPLQAGSFAKIAHRAISSRSDRVRTFRIL